MCEPKVRIISIVKIFIISALSVILSTSIVRAEPVGNSESEHSESEDSLIDQEIQRQLDKAGASLITDQENKTIYVFGAVKEPGKIAIKGDTITVKEAMVQAGLPLLSAKLEKCRLIRPQMIGRPETMLINLEKLLYKGDVDEEWVMRPGDALYVPYRLMDKLFLDPLAPIPKRKLYDSPVTPEDQENDNVS